MYIPRLLCSSAGIYIYIYIHRCVCVCVCVYSLYIHVCMQGLDADCLLKAFSY